MNASTETLRPTVRCSLFSVTDEVVDDLKVPVVPELDEYIIGIRLSLPLSSAFEDCLSGLILDHGSVEPEAANEEWKNEPGRTSEHILLHGITNGRRALARDPILGKSISSSSSSLDRSLDMSMSGDLVKLTSRWQLFRR